MSFKAELDMLQNISFQFEPDTPPTIPLNVKNLCLQLKRSLCELKLSSPAQTFHIFLLFFISFQPVYY